MSILYLLIPLAVGLMVVAIAFFLWTVRTGQYDDLEGPAHRILMDDDDPMIPGNAERKQKAAKAPRASGQDKTNAPED
ncbi:MAG: cbb3-type cytochrome oxidase assembly protein CcoS [Chromatiaceae bacterium]|jgi:cbb3-type cytochrome oxidase maturation protein